MKKLLCLNLLLLVSCVTVNASDLDLEELRLKIEATHVDLESIVPSAALKKLFEENLFLEALTLAKSDSHAKTKALYNAFDKEYVCSLLNNRTVFISSQNVLAVHDYIKARVLEEERALKLEDRILRVKQAMALNLGQPAIEFAMNVMRVRGQIQHKLAFYPPYYKELENNKNMAKADLGL